MCDDYKLIAKLGNLKTVVQLLKSVNFKEVSTEKYLKKLKIDINENLINFWKNLLREQHVMAQKMVWK